MQVTIPAVYGVSCSLVTLPWALTHRKDQRIGKALCAILAIAVMYDWAFPKLLNFEDHLVPWRYDDVLLLLDRAMGLSVVSFDLALPDWLWIAFALAYKSLLWMVTLWGFLHLTKPWGKFRALATAFVTSYAIVGFLYLIVPASGPAYTPVTTRHGMAAPILLGGQPNAMPSMHVASALILVLFAGTNRWLRAISILFLIGTAGGTVLGEHYFVDWAGSIPFACFAVALGLGEKRKAAIYFSATIAWLLLIRFAGPLMVEHPAILQVTVLGIAVLGADAVIRAWSDSAQPKPALIPAYAELAP